MSPATLAFKVQAQRGTDPESSLAGYCPTNEVVVSMLCLQEDHTIFAA